MMELVMFNFIKNTLNAAKEKSIAIKAAKEYEAAYVERVQVLLNQIASTKEGFFDESAPFKLKKNERYIGSTQAILGTYKNDGRIAGHGVSVRIPIAKGVAYKVGGGRVGMAKSWVYDQRGILHFTSERIVFNGENTNSTTSLDKVIDITLGDAVGSSIMVDRETGKDWSFKVVQIPEDKLATLLACQKGVFNS
jgi:hypothetical protein